MKAGVNRIQGRNSNFLDFNGDGSTVLSSGNTSILINTDNIPTAPITTKNAPGTVTVVPNLTKTTGSFDSIIDIIPLTSSVSPLDIRPTASLNIKDIFATIGDNDISLIPDEEDFFTLFGEIIQDSEVDESVTNSTNSTNANLSGVQNLINSVPYIKQINGWTCLVTSNIIILQHAGYNVSFNTFGLNNNGSKTTGKNKYLTGTDGKLLNYTAVQKDFPKYTFTKRTKVNDPIAAYKKQFLELGGNKPMIIVIDGIGDKSKTHYVVMVGIDANGNLIVHDPRNKSFAYKDTIITSADVSNKFQYIYIK